MNNFDYIPEQWPPPGADATSRPYSGPGQRRPPRHARTSGPLPAPAVVLNGHSVRGYPSANGHAVPGYEPPNGHGDPRYPDAAPRYGPVNGQSAAGYRPVNGYAAPYYPPTDTRPFPAYPPTEYPPPASQQTAYPPAEYRPGDGKPAVHTSHRSRYPLLIEQTAPPGERRAPSGGRQLPGWLPFGQRLVLLPRTGPADEDQELREHRDVAGGWLRPAVFGAMDGLVTNASLIAGIGGGGGGPHAIVLTGIAGLIAGAFSMATGEYISVTSQNELTEAEVRLERQQHRRDPTGKRKRLIELFIAKGVSPNLAEAVARQISADPDRAVATLVREELGIDPDDLPSPRTAAAASFAAFTVGALIPLSPYLIGYPVLRAALVLAGVAAVAGGAAVARLTERPMLAGGLRQFAAAFLATGMAFVVGHLVGGRIM